MSEKVMVECAVCMEETVLLDEFNGEMMCHECYHDPDNYVFGDDKNE